MKLSILASSVVVSVGLAAPLAAAENSPDALQTLMGRSDLIVIGNIVDEKMVILDEQFVLNHLCDFQVEDVLKGDAALKDQLINVNIIRFEREPKDEHPLVKEGDECILFLKLDSTAKPTTWSTVDHWFGVQFPSPWMAEDIKRLSGQK